MRTLLIVLAVVTWLAALPVQADTGKHGQPSGDPAAAERDLARLRSALKEVADLAGEIFSGAYGKGQAKRNGGSNPDSRRQRSLRWALVFDTKDGEDYRQQLEGLRAILAVPDKGGQYRVFRNLKPPVRGEIEDLKEINRIFWVDDEPKSVELLAKALKLVSTPKHVVVFFPESLEDELKRQELAYQGLKVEEIELTRFEVRRQGNTYVTGVKDQRAKAGKGFKAKEKPKEKAVPPQVGTPKGKNTD